MMPNSRRAHHVQGLLLPHLLSSDESCRLFADFSALLNDLTDPPPASQPDLSRLNSHRWALGFCSIAHGS